MKVSVAANTGANIACTLASTFTGSPFVVPWDAGSSPAGWTASNLAPGIYWLYVFSQIALGDAGSYKLAISDATLTAIPLPDSYITFTADAADANTVDISWLARSGGFTDTYHVQIDVSLPVGSS